MPVRPMNIVLSSDAHYVQHAGVAMASVIANALAGEDIRFYFLHDGLPADAMDKLTSIMYMGKPRHVDCRVEFVRVDRAKFANFPAQGYFSPANYYRLLVGDMLPGVERCLYLDSDLIVVDSLRALYETDLQGKMVGMVPDRDAEIQGIKWKLKPGQIYCNSGVLLIDLDKWRGEKVFERSIDFICKHAKEIKLCDQDVINPMLADDISVLDNRYNIQQGREVLKAFKRSGKKPCIYHYTGRHKPWMPSARRFAGAKHYFTYLKETPWKSMPVFMHASVYGT